MKNSGPHFPFMWRKCDWSISI